MARRARESTPESKKFTDQLDELVKEKRRGNITQAAICEATGIAPSSMSAWLNDEASPTLEAINKLADYFCVSTDFLLGRISARSPNPNAQAAELYTGLSSSCIETLHLLSDSSEFSFVKRFLDDFVDFTGSCLMWQTINRSAIALAISQQTNHKKQTIDADIKNILNCAAQDNPVFQLSPLDAADYWRSTAIADIVNNVENIVNEVIDELCDQYTRAKELNKEISIDELSLSTSDDEREC